MKKFLPETHPEIVKEWHPIKNTIKPSQVTYGSDKKVWWLCSKDPRHEWFAKVNNRARRGIGCPVCAGKLVIAGVNDLATTHPKLAAEWDTDRNPLPATEVVAGSGKKAYWICSTCNYGWYVSPNGRTSNNSGCPLCAGQVVVAGRNDLATTHPDLVKEWHPTKNTLNPEQVSKGSKKYAWWLCQYCGNEWRASIVRRASKGSGCPSCKLHKVDNAESLAALHPDLVKEWHHAKNIFPPEKLKSASNRIVWWICKEGHEWETAVYQRTKENRTKCPVCCPIGARKVVPQVNDLETLSPELMKEWDYEKNKKQPSGFSPGTKRKAWWVCPKGHSYLAPIGNRTKENGTGCRRCAMNGTSRAEQDVYALVQTLVPDAKLHDRSIAANYEYDISVPSKKIAIEYNGIYWHSEEFKPRNYHKDKSEAARDQGWQVITVWEDDWLNKRHVVEKMLAHKLGVSNQPKYNARSLTTQNITTTQAKDFLNENHIQGAVGGSIRLGLYTTQPNPVLVAVMLFKVRSHQEKTFELVRYATSGIVRGGFSKLFKHFTTNYYPHIVISFSDFEVSDGNLYTNNGFVQEGHLAPDYMYVANGIREHKFNYRKNRFKNDPHLIYDPELTERQLAELNDIPRVYDSGKTKWVWYN